MPKFGTFRFGIEKFGDYTPVEIISYAAKYSLGTGTYSGQGYTKTNGYAIEGKDMLVNQSIRDAIASQISRYELKLYIQDSNYNWIDFSARANIDGRNQLRKIGSISYSSEGLQGNVRQRVGGIVLDDSDGFWRQPFPPDLYASYDKNWNWIGGQQTAAVFSYSKNKKEHILYRHKLCVKANYIATGSDIPQEITLGVFLIDRTRANRSARSFEITATSLDYPLAEEDASVVKHGTDWYTNRSVPFLVRELLKRQYLDTTTGDLPTTFDIDDMIDYRVPDIDNTGWAISHAGRPPENTYNRSTTGWEDTSSWNEENRKLSKAICGHEITTGTLTVTAGSSTVTVSGGNLSDLTYALMAGDVLTIPREYVSGDGGSTGHYGHYTISSIDTSANTITLTEPVRGRTDESGLRWAVTRLYISAGNELYWYSQAKDAYYRITNDTTEKLPTDYIITRLWYNANDSTWPIWGVAVTDSKNTAGGEYLQIFRTRFNGTQPVFELYGSAISEVLTGEYCVEYPTRGKIGDAAWYLQYYAGQFDSDVSGDDSRLAIPIPFDQYLGGYEQSEMYAVWRNNTSIDEIEELEIQNEENEYDARVDVTWCRRGSYSALWTVSNPPGCTKWSLGQTGFIVFQPNWGSNGMIIFAKYVYSSGLPTYDSHGRIIHKYYYVDISETTPSATELSMGSTWDGMDQYEKGMPICGAADPDNGNLYIGCYAKPDDNMDPMPDHIQATWKLTSSTSGASLYDNTATYGNVIEMAVINGYLHGVFLSWDALSDSMTDVKYTIVAYSGSALYPQIAQTTSEIHGLTAMKMYNSGTSSWDDACFYIEANTQRLRYFKDPLFTLSYPTNTIIEYSGFMRDEPYALSNVWGSYQTMQMFWISSPQPNVTIPELAEGRFALNQWSYNIFARIELADFTDMKIWNALGYFAEKVDALYGFYPDGNFFFKRKPFHAYSVETLTNTGSNMIQDITVEAGYGEIVNSATRSPSRVGIPPTEVVWELSTGSKYDEDGYRHNIDIYRSTLASRNIRLICTKGGHIATGLDSAGNPQNTEATFKFDVIDASINTMLIADVTTASDLLYLNDEFPVLYGSYVKINGRDQEQVTNNEDVVDDTWGTCRIGYVAQQDTKDVVLKTAINATTSLLEFEEYGGSAVNFSSALGNGLTITVGTQIVIGDFDNGTNLEYCQIVDIGSDTLVVKRASEYDRGKRTSHSAGEKMALLRNGNAYYIRSNETGLAANYPSGYSGKLFEVGDAVTIDLPSSGISTTAMVNPIDDSSSTGIDDFVPVDNVYMQIGGDNMPTSTGVYACFTFPGSTSNEPKFAVGDIIRINAPGLSLSNDATVSHSYTDMGSVAVYSKRDSRGTTRNPFLSDDDARWIVRREVNDKRFPKHTITVICTSMPWLLPGQVITIQSPTMLPRATQHQEDVYISTIRFNTQYNGLMELACRGIDPY